MPVKKVSAKEMLGGHSAVIMPGSPMFARLKKFHEDKAASRDKTDSEKEPHREPPAD